jgi:hypothetical protein
MGTAENRYATRTRRLTQHRSTKVDLLFRLKGLFTISTSYVSLELRDLCHNETRRHGRV